MKRKTWIWRIVGGGAMVLLAAVIGIVVYARREPSWSPAYFTPELRTKYATVEECYQHTVAAMQATDPTLYREVLGYDQIEIRKFPLYQGPVPSIEELIVDDDQAFIWTSNRWEMNFCWMNGRWVFQPETLAFALQGFKGPAR